MSSIRQRAFTLIEVLVVILILAVMSAIVVPAYARYLEKARFDSEIHQIQDIFAYSRERAVALDTNVTLHFDRGSDTFVAAADNPRPDEPDQPAVFQNAEYGDQQSGPEVHQVYKVGDDYRVENFSAMGITSDGSNAPPASQSEIHFRGDGTSDGAVMDVVSHEGYVVHLTLWPAIGRLTVEEDSGQRQ